jgi:hypothetical protein
MLVPSFSAENGVGSAVLFPKFGGSQYPKFLKQKFTINYEKKKGFKIMNAESVEPDNPLYFIDSRYHF